MKLDNILIDQATNDIVTDTIVLTYLNGVTEGKSSRVPVDIGDGFYAKRVGHDINGNWSYWVSRGANRFRKIEATNINGGSNKITDVHDFNNPEYADTVKAIKEYYMSYIAPVSYKAKVDEGLSNDFRVDLSHSELNNIPNTLSYKLNNVVIETPKGSVNVPDAGILSLDMGEKELVKRLLEDTDDQIIKVNDIVIKQPPTDISFSGPFAATGAYTVLVSYTTQDGNEKQKEVNFNDLNFTQSDSFLQFFQNLK